MAGPSKELLDFTGLKPSIIESLQFSKKAPSLNTQSEHQASGAAGEKPLIAAVPLSPVLGQVKDFLGVMARANEKLELDSQENSRAKYDIEAIDGDNQEYIEMNLLLGVADLHTDEAVAAAEATMSRFSASKSFPDDNSSSSDTDEDGNDDDDDDGNRGITVCEEGKNPKSDSTNTLMKNRSSKRPKIVVLD